MKLTYLDFKIILIYLAYGVHLCGGQKTTWLEFILLLCGFWGSNLVRSTGLFPLGPLTSLSFICLVLEKEKEDEDDDEDYSSQTWLLEIIGAEEVCWEVS